MDRHTPTVAELVRRAVEICDPGELIRLAVRAQWHGHPPLDVSDWLAGRGLKI
jgi:hypothetical protein